MMNKRVKRSRISLAFAGIGAGLLALIAPNAQATPDTPRHDHRQDCRIVAKSDRTLCLKVQRQRAYGWTYGPNGEGVALNPSGIVDVHDATHQGLTRDEMHDYLLGYRDQYREHVTHVTVNVDALRPGCRWVIDTVTREGVKVTRKRAAC